MVRERLQEIKDRTLESFTATNYPEAGAVIGVRDNVAICYQGNALRPTWFYRFIGTAQRDRYIADYIIKRAVEIAEITERKIAKKAKAATDKLIVIDLAKLTRDLVEAHRLARAAADATDDGGTCNTDGLYLRLANVKDTAAVAAIRASGLSSYKMRHSWYGVGYLINPNVPGQGNKRMYAAEAMCRHMRAAGYDLSAWSQMD